MVSVFRMKAYIAVGSTLYVICKSVVLHQSRLNRRLEMQLGDTSLEGHARLTDLRELHKRYGCKLRGT